MKIETTRRKALAIFGLGVSSAPLAAKQLAEEGAAAVAGVNLNSLSTTMGSTSLPDYYAGSVEYEKQFDRAAEFFDLFGTPEHIKAELQRNGGYVSRLDPDIASKRSWSLAVKIVTQRERNRNREYEAVKDAIRSRQARKTFRTVAGFDWPFHT